MNLSAAAIKFRPVVVTLVGMITIWGTITFFTMSRREDPEFTIRTCTVSTSWPGTPTVKVEELITDKLEEELDSIEEVDYIKSETRNGQSVIYVYVEDRLPPGDIQQVWDKVRAKVNDVPMPAEGIRPIVNDEFGDTTILLLGIYQVPLEGQETIDPDYKYSARQLELYADTVRDALRLLPGVAKVDKYGVQDEAIHIETELGIWSQLDLTISDLRTLVQNRNIVSPGGSIDTDNGKFNVRPGGEFDGVSEINSIGVGTVRKGDSTNKVKLSEVGLKVERDFVDPAQVICRFTEERGTFDAVMVGLTMKSGSNIVDICEAAMERVDQLVRIQQALPRDLMVKPVSQASDNVSAKINDVVSNVISAIVIVVIVVYLFVGLRTSLVMAANIPVVVIGSIAFISLFGVELEQISLASIIIALGLLVDNAVQVCDQTRTNILEGMKPTKAAIKGANTLMLPMLTGTMTTVVAFFPMIFALEGGSAEYVYSLPVTLSTTLLLSWLFAMSICVILASAFIRAPKDPTKPDAPLPWLSVYIEAFRRKITGKKVDPNDPSLVEGDNMFLEFYGWLAKIAIQFKWVTVLGSIAILFAALQLPVSSEFFPQDRRDQFYINVTLPETSTISQTDEIVRSLEETIKKISPYVDPETGETVERLRTMRSLTGQGGARWALSVDPPSPGANVAEILVRTTDGKYTEQMILDLRSIIDEGDPELGLEPISGARIVTKKLSMGPSAAPVNLRVSGDGFADINELRRISDEIKLMLREEEGTWDIADSWGIDSLQINVEVDENRANLAGVTNSNIADTLNAYFSGLQLTTFREGDHQIPVYFRLDRKRRGDLSRLDAAFVEGYNGKVPLNSVASIEPTWQPGMIERRDQNRTIEVSAEVEDSVSGNDVVLRVWNSSRMAELKESLPVGFKIEIGGALEESQDASVQMMTSFAVSFICIVLILVIQYNGWSKTLIILTTLPLAVIGAWLGLYLTDNPLGFMPQLGLLSLFGIVLNTGIIFVEFADILIANKRDELAESNSADGPIVGLTKSEFHDCLVAAGKQRMLPIFLTTATTICGLLPLAFAGGPLWEGMSWLMIYGLVVATLLTLFVVPALYAIIVEAFRVKPVPEFGEDEESDPTEE